jgi:phage-related minor tail protein
MADDTITVKLEADTGDFLRSLDEADRTARALGNSLTRAFDGAAVRGQSLQTVLGTLALRLTDITLKAALRPLDNALGAALSGLVNSASTAVSPFAKGGMVSAPVMPFAAGGVVAAPTYFPLSAGRTGLAGEAGPEAILPLARGADGRLGVSAGASAAPVSVTVNIATPDVGGFRKSEAQVAATLARAVARGRRGM